MPRNSYELSTCPINDLESELFTKPIKNTNSLIFIHIDHNYLEGSAKKWCYENIIRNKIILNYQSLEIVFSKLIGEQIMCHSVPGKYNYLRFLNLFLHWID